MLHALALALLARSLWLARHLVLHYLQQHVQLVNSPSLELQLILRLVLDDIKRRKESNEVPVHISNKPRLLEAVHRRIRTVRDKHPTVPLAQAVEPLRLG